MANKNRVKQEETPITESSFFLSSELKLREYAFVCWLLFVHTFTSDNINNENSFLLPDGKYASFCSSLVQLP